MKKILSMRTVLLMGVLLVFSLVSCALADATAPIVTKTIGKGATTTGVYIQEGYDDDQVIYYNVSTDSTTLLDALQQAALVEGEEASWGYNITTVDGVKADYDGKGQYWSIWVYDDEQQEFVQLDTPVGTTNITTGDDYLFFLEES